MGAYVAMITYLIYISFGDRCGTQNDRGDGGGGVVLFGLSQ